MDKIYELLELIGFERQTRTMFKLDDNYLFVVDKFSMTLMYRDNEGKWDDLQTVSHSKNIEHSAFFNDLITFLHERFKSRLRKNKINELL